MKAADWTFTKILPDVEDAEAMSKAGYAFFRKPPAAPADPTREVHCFDAGFMRGLAWGLAKSYGAPERAREALAFRAAAGVVETLRNVENTEIVKTLRGMANLIEQGPVNVIPDTPPRGCTTRVEAHAVPVPVRFKVEAGPGGALTLCMCCRRIIPVGQDAYAIPAPGAWETWCLQCHAKRVEPGDVVADQCHAPTCVGKLPHVRGSEACTHPLKF